MKKTHSIFATGVLAGSLIVCSFNASATMEVSVDVQINAVSDFYEPLNSNGAWVEVGTYGRCWHPSHVVAEWRPYCDGTWVWTDAGWYWQSDEPWAWACYHYGTWVFDSAYGWVWVPDVEWAPAWVYWRVGGGHIGWAPCAPRFGFVAPTAFVFVQDRRFRERHRPANIIVNDVTIINNTTEIKEINREKRTVGGRQQTVLVNRGPAPAIVEKATGQKLTALSVQEATRQTTVPTTVTRRSNKAAEKEKAPASTPIVKEKEQPKPAPEFQPKPNTTREIPNRPAPSDKTVPSEKKKEVPVPTRPRAEVPPIKPPPSERKVAPPQPSQPLPHQPAPSVNEKNRKPEKEKPKDRDNDGPPPK